MIALWIAAPLAVTLAVAWLCRSVFGGSLTTHAHKAAYVVAASELGLAVLALALFPFMPGEGNRQGGTCTSYRRGSLDEVVLSLGWASAVLGGLVIAGSLAAREARKPGPWRTAMLLAALTPYVIFIAYVVMGLCYALDT